MSEKSAVEIYTTEPLNCAQSILKGFQSDYSVTDKKIAEFGAYGSGRAEGGMCGALFAALELLETAEAKKHLTTAFIERVGSPKCREIRKAGEVSCKECVEIASDLVSSNLQNA